jgi:hypothetical protein
MQHNRRNAPDDGPEEAAGALEAGALGGGELSPMERQRIMHVPRSMLPPGCKKGAKYSMEVMGEADGEDDFPVSISDGGGSKGGHDADYDEYVRHEMKKAGQGDTTIK